MTAEIDEQLESFSDKIASGETFTGNGTGGNFNNTTGTPIIYDLEQAQTNGQVQPLAFVYELKCKTNSEDKFLISVISANATTAKTAIAQHFGEYFVAYMCTCTRLLQVNG